MKQGAKAIQSKHIMGWTVTENLNLKYLTSFKDRHNKRRYYFRYHGQKFKLPGKVGSVEFHEAYAAYLAKVEGGTLGRNELGYLKGSIGWVIESFLASDVGFGKLKPGTQRNYPDGSIPSKQRLVNFRSTT